MISFKQKGNFNHTEKFLKYATDIAYMDVFHRYGREGVAALAAATPQDSGETANSWTYEIKSKKGWFALTWKNTHIVNGVPIAIILQYGHGTRNGGFVQGRDYINPTIRPIFDKISNDIWREVTRL